VSENIPSWSDGAGFHAAADSFHAPGSAHFPSQQHWSQAAAAIPKPAVINLIEHRYGGSVRQLFFFFFNYGIFFKDKKLRADTDTQC